jgi:hypothetical protein
MCLPTALGNDGQAFQNGCIWGVDINW